MTKFEKYEGELRNMQRLFMLKCEAALLTNKNTDPNSSFTERRTKQKITEEIKDYLEIIKELKKRGYKYNLKDLLNYMFDY
jgi:hypothetical protein